MSDIRRDEFLDLKEKVDSIYNAVKGDDMRKGIRDELGDLQEFRSKQEKRNNMFAGGYALLIFLITVWQAVKHLIIKS